MDSEALGRGRDSRRADSRDRRRPPPESAAASRSESRTLTSVANWARKPPVARGVLPAPGSRPRSMTMTSRQPRCARWKATLAPITPAPMIVIRRSFHAVTASQPTPARPERWSASLTRLVSPFLETCTAPVEASWWCAGRASVVVAPFLFWRSDEWEDDWAFFLRSRFLPGIRL